MQCLRPLGRRLEGTAGRLELPHMQETLIPSQAVPWPAVDPGHWWRQAPENGTQQDYKQFWAQKGLSPAFGIP